MTLNKFHFIPSNKNLSPFLLGMSAFITQIYLLREFGAQFFGNEISFAVCLASWFFWGGMGSLWTSRFGQKGVSPVTRLLQILVLFSVVLAIIRFLRPLLGRYPGEAIPLLPMVTTGFFLMSVVSFPLGALFVQNVRFLSGRLISVFIFESLGAAAAGIPVYFAVIPLLSNWKGAALGLVGIGFLSIPLQNTKKDRWTAGILILVSALLFFSDRTLLRCAWKPFSLLQTKDTPYGKIQVIETGGQISVYVNSHRLYSFADRADAEETVHFNMLQRPEPLSVLLIGGGLGGTLDELLKYHNVDVDHVELDPSLIHTARPFLSDAERETMDNPRIHTIFEDGRLFLQRTKKTYEAVILDLPDPSTAQLNRFFTLSFFQQVRKKLQPNGIFSFKVQSSPHIISPELQSYLSLFYHTLREVFPEVRIVPGNSAVFLASDRSLTLDPEVLLDRMNALGLNVSHVGPGTLYDRLEPQRVLRIEQSAQEGTSLLNLDGKPVGYYLHSILWAKQFRGPEYRFLKTLQKSSRALFAGLLFSTMAVFGLYFLISKKRSAKFLLPLAGMGLSSIVLEMVLILAFQARLGVLYRGLSLLFTCFMAGLFLGSRTAGRQKDPVPARLITLQAAITVLCGATALVLPFMRNMWSFSGILLLLGFLNGHLFVDANRLYLNSGQNTGLGYGLDLLGSFFGALVSGIFLFPLLGQTLILLSLFFLNGFSLLLLAASIRRA